MLHQAIAQECLCGMCQEGIRSIPLSPPQGVPVSPILSSPLTRRKTAPSILR